MILPTKHVSPSNSLIGLGALLLAELDEPLTVSSLWERSKKLKQVGTFQRFTLCLDMLFSIGSIEFEKGLLVRKEHA